MEYKVFIFSNKLLNGELEFDLNKFNKICGSNFISLSSIEIKNFDLERQFLEEENLIIFCENENLDNLIIKNISNLGSKKELIDEQIVVFNKAGIKRIFIPIEGDLNLLNKTFDKLKNVEILKIFGLSQIDIKTKLESLKSEIDFEYKIIYKNLLADVYINYENDNAIKDRIKSLFNQNIYSENESLTRLIYNLLEGKNYTLSIYENITNGLILNSLLEENEGFYNHLKEIKIEQFECPNSDFLVDRALKTLKESGCDLSIVTHGRYNDNSLEFDFALATQNEVHVYKNNFKAQKENALEMAKNSLLFNLVKKLR